MKLLSLFSGIGAFEEALKRLNIEFETVGISEIDKYAIKSYYAIHGACRNFGSVTDINTSELPSDIDLITYGFPCQDISLAGKQRGFEHEGEKTRSGLFFEALRIIEDTKPKFAIAENVKNLVSKKFKNEFQIVLDSLEKAGYNNYWKVLNAKDFGIPQNRERVFIISIRKDVDDGTFEFPEGFELNLRLKDMLEDEVDEKYYISEKGIALFNRQLETQKDRTTRNDQITLVQLAHGYNQGQEFDADIMPTITQGTAMHWHTLIKEKPKILVSEATKKGYAEAFEGDSVNLEQPNSKTRRGRVGKQVSQTLTTSCNQGVVINKLEPINEMPDGTCRTIKNQYYKTSKANFERNSTFGATGVKKGLRIRKLTPKECWRLMGFDDEDFEKAELVNSNTQLYKQAGNSIVVNVLVEIFKQLYKKN